MQNFRADNIHYLAINFVLILTYSSLSFILNSEAKTLPSERHGIVKQNYFTKSLNKIIFKQEIIRHIVKRYAMPDPRPKGGGGPPTKVEPIGHGGLVIRHKLFVSKPALYLTVIVLIGSLCVVIFSIGYYWRTLLCRA